MSNDDPDSMKTTVHSTSISDGVTTPTHENPSIEDWLFDMAARCHVPLRRQDGESLHAVADRLTLDIERMIALYLLYLDDINNLDFSDGS